MRTVLSFLLIVVLAGCVTQSEPPAENVLRVGVSPNSQPVIFKESGKIKGIEADYARKIGESLGYDIRFVEVDWDQQIDYLLDNKTDLIMSGMTVTQPRMVRISFCTPYLQSGLSGLFRRDSYDPSSLLGSIVMNQNKSIGAVKNTTGAMFVQRQFPRSDLKQYSSTQSAVKALKSGKISTFIHDAPMVWWTAAVNENELISFPQLLNNEPLAWGMRKEERELREAINKLVVQWEKDGTTKQIITTWLPGIVQ